MPQSYGNKLEAFVQNFLGLEASKGKNCGIFLVNMK
jgi:hypothetical protein